MATLLALRDRLGAGDLWVEGSRQWRAVEDQLIPLARFAAMREAGPLPLAAPTTAEEYLAERRALLERRLAEVNAKAAADRLDDARITCNELKISPLKAVTPAEAEALADRLYAMMPNLRITSLLAEVDRWTGFSCAFTHLHSGAPAETTRLRVAPRRSRGRPAGEGLTAPLSVRERLPSGRGTSQLLERKNTVRLYFTYQRSG
jgi:hypothetical protein